MQLHRAAQHIASAEADPVSEHWLGNFCDREAVRNSGLWNVNCVAKEPEGAALNALERRIHQMSDAVRSSKLTAICHS